jgi:sugar/nucleoside kinase (ribokinase family)
MSKIMTMGEILVEIMATRLGQSFRQPGRLLGPYPSGAPAIFIDQVAKLGHPCGMIGCVGDDDFGWLNIDRLERDGADTGAIVRLQDAVTGSAFVTYKESGDRDFIFNITNSASARLSEEMIGDAVLADCSHFHVMGSSLFSSRIIGAMNKAIEIVKAQGGTISFDPNIRKELLTTPAMRLALQHILKFTDVFLPSGDEVTLLTGAATEQGAIDELLAAGIGEIVVKRGKLGATYYAANQRIDLPALAIQEIDPTGAGDCFGASFVTCRKMGMPPGEALSYAVASGARAVLRKGPMEGTASFAELDAWLAELAAASLPYPGEQAAQLV